MPGYRRPHTTAFAPGDLQGFDALERAFQGGQWSKNTDGRPSVRSQAYAQKRRSVPTTYADIPSSEGSSLRSESPNPEVQATVDEQTVTPTQTRSGPRGLRRMPAELVTPPLLTRENNSGLPPTPPTMANSDEAEVRKSSLPPNVHFADAVRNALHGQKSGLSTPRHHLPTPDPSPPGTRENVATISLHSSRLKPAPPGQLSRNPSTRGDSFHTAREDPMGSQLNLPRTPSVESHFSKNWLNSTGAISLGELGRGLSYQPHASPTHNSQQPEKCDGKSQSEENSTPTPTRHKQRPVSPEHREISESDLDKQVSYLSDENLKEETSAEDINNLIYSRIREENVKRHSAMSEGSAVPAGVYVDQQMNKEHKLRRAPGAQNLRNGHWSGRARGEHQQYELQRAGSRQPRLRHKDIHLPTRSLEASPEITSDSKTHRLKRETGRDHLRPASQRSAERLNGQKTGDSLRRSTSSLNQQASVKHTLRHVPAGMKLDHNRNTHKTSLDTDRSLLSSQPRKSLDTGRPFLSATPVSVSHSQMSDHSNMEVCEARGVSIFPHNNESLLLVQQGSNSTDKSTETPESVALNALQDGSIQTGPSAIQETPTRDNHLAPPIIHVDSPLTNPREAPAPPVFKVIPPTPNDEPDRQLGRTEQQPSADNPPTTPQRRLSLAQRARRFSESFMDQPIFTRSLSMRKQQPPRAVSQEARPTYLSPFWRPTDIWDGYDSDEDYDEAELEGIPSASARLPQGGDTSDFAPPPDRKRSLFPRNMSVRMPGFRGQGGFLLGNSLGLDRHGTNNRRPYVVKKSSSGGLRTKSSQHSESLRRKASEEMLRQTVRRQPGFALPFFGGRRVEYVGLARFRERMRQRMDAREEKVRERRRAVLREQIQHQR
ncbi:hypothetical protein D0862_05359 [Hortaea werneckii]|uniref:Uncharacterized protein n=1 Tax=Hortaea werneckii TaxID=91943 RepID=A0A3M7GU54_HORWE|nr:hypothetical protein D0862_05359 [Hortaea werneckii]